MSPRGFLGPSIQNLLGQRRWMSSQVLMGNLGCFFFPLCILFLLFGRGKERVSSRKTNQHWALKEQPADWFHRVSLGSLSCATSLRWSRSAAYKAICGICHKRLQRWCRPWADGWLRRGLQGVYWIVTKGKKIGAFKFRLQGRKKKRLKQLLADYQKSEPLIVFINSKIISKCFFSIRGNNVHDLHADPWTTVLC